MAFQSFDERVLHIENTRTLPANGTNYNTVATGAGIGTRIDALLLVNTDAIAHVVTLRTNRGGTVCVIGSVTVPAGQGTAGTPPLEVFATLNLTNYPAVFLLGQDVLQIACAVAMTAATELDSVAMGGDF